MITHGSDVRGDWKFERSITVDEKYAGRFARASFRYTMLTPQNFSVPAVPFVIAVFFAIVAARHYGVESGLFLFTVAVAIVAPLLVLASFVLGWGLARRYCPAGSTLRIAMSEELMQVTNSRATQEVRYGSISDVRTRKGFVFAQRGGSNRRARSGFTSFVVWPEDLFTNESLAYLEEHVAIANR